jgi:hypothetical protein
MLIKTEFKRVYRVVTRDNILSSHTSAKAAYRSLVENESYAARGFCGMTPETLISVERWNGSAWVAINS